MNRQGAGSVSPAVGVAHIAGHLAVWPGFYAAGALLLLAWLTNAPIAWTVLGPGVVFVFLCGQAAYLLDRVKISGARMDPSDRMAQPDRQAYLGGMAGLARGLAGVELVAAAVIGAMVSPRLAPVPLGVGIGVWLYAGRPADPARPRPKDRPTAKALLVAIAHTALAGAVLLGGSPDAGREAGPFAEACVILLAIVFADAVVCDLDDLEADRHYGTRSVPVQIGVRRSWALAAATYLACGVAVWAFRPLRSALLLAALLAVSCAAAAVMPRRRDFIDARLFLIAAICVLLG